MAGVVLDAGGRSFDDLYRMMEDMQMNDDEDGQRTELIRSTLVPLAGQGPFTKGSTQYEAIKSASHAAHEVVHHNEEYAHTLGCALAPFDPPLTPNGGASAVYFLGRAATYCLKRERRLRLQGHIGMHMSFGDRWVVPQIPTITEKWENGDRVYTVAELPPAATLTVMGLFVDYFRQSHPWLVKKTGEREWSGFLFKDGCAAFFAYIVRTESEMVELHRDWIYLFFSIDDIEELEEPEEEVVKLDSLNVSDSLLTSAASWHIFEPDKLDYEEEPEKEDRFRAEDRWKERVIAPIKRCIEMLFNKQRPGDAAVFTPQGVWKPYFFEMIAQELKGVELKRDRLSNTLISRSGDYPSVGFPPVWHDQPFARMCAVLGAFNALDGFKSMLEHMMPDHKGTKPNLAKFLKRLIDTLRRLGVAHATSHTTGIEIVVFCVVQWVVLHIDPSDESKIVFSNTAYSEQHISNARRFIKRCLEFLVHAHDAHPEEITHVLDSHTCWPTSQIKYKAPIWRDARDCLLVCEALQVAFQKNAMHDFCQDFITQLGM